MLRNTSTAVAHWCLAPLAHPQVSLLARRPFGLIVLPSYCPAGRRGVNYFAARPSYQPAADLPPR